MHGPKPHLGEYTPSTTEALPAVEAAVVDVERALEPVSAAEGSLPVDLSLGEGEGATLQRLTALEAEISNLKALVEAFGTENETLTNQCRFLEEEADTQRSKVEELEYRLSKMAAKPRGPEATLGANLERERVTAEVLDGNPSLSSALRFLQYSFPTHVLVLPSAYESAEASASFKHRDKAFLLLRKLTLDYWEALVSGHGDGEARQIFGEPFSANESETVLSNETAIRQRSFIYDGEKVVMNKHLRIGVKDSLSETWRCHFHWDARKKLVVIGHCGRHLDFG